MVKPFGNFEQLPVAEAQAGVVNEIRVAVMGMLGESYGSHIYNSARDSFHAALDKIVPLPQSAVAEPVGYLVTNGCGDQVQDNFIKAKDGIDRAYIEELFEDKNPITITVLYDHRHPVPTPSVAKVENGLTADETAAMDHLVDFWNIFTALPVQHASDAREMEAIIHSAQARIMARHGRRAFPDYYTNEKDQQR